MAPAPTRKDTFRVTLTVDGNDWGVFETRTGGKTNGNSGTTKPGGMGPQIALGGTPTVEPVTLTRNYDRVRDHDRADQLTNRAGRARCVCKQRPLDADANAYGKSIVWTGILNAVDLPEHDANASDSAVMTLEITPDGPVSFQ